MERAYSHSIKLIDFIHYMQKVEMMIKDEQRSKMNAKQLIEKIKTIIDVDAQTVGYFFAY